MKKAIIIGKNGHHYSIGDIVQIKQKWRSDYICYPVKCETNWSSNYWQIVVERDLSFLPGHLNALTRTL